MERRDRILSRYKLDFKLIREIDKGLLFSAIALMLYGMLNIYLCTKGDVAPFFFVKKQFMWFIISMVALYFLVAVDYSVIYRYVPIFYWGSVILLLCVWIPGIGVKVNGARGWINIGISNLQPAELAKFGIILMVAKLLEEMDYEVNNLRNIIKIGIYCMIPVSLILIQPDMGMTMVCFFIVLGMLFIAGLDRRIIIGGFSALLIGVVVLWNSGLILPHQKARITAKSIFNWYWIRRSCRNKTILRSRGFSRVCRYSCSRNSNRFYICSYRRTMGILRSHAFIITVRNTNY